MSSSGRPASPKQTLLSAGMEAGGTLQETPPTVANWAPTKQTQEHHRKQKMTVKISPPFPFKARFNIFNDAVQAGSHLRVEEAALHRLIDVCDGRTAGVQEGQEGFRVVK